MASQREAPNTEPEEDALESLSELQPQTRRDFLDTVIGGTLLLTAAAGAYGTLSYLTPAPGSKGGVGEAEEVGAESDLPPGEGKVYAYKNTSVIVINLEREGLVAFSATCTHAACNVYWDKSQGRIACPCHAGIFDTNGGVVSGPPNKPLARYKVSVVGSKIVVGGG